MKRVYVKPESVFVDIVLHHSILSLGNNFDENVQSGPLTNDGLWDENSDKLPKSKSVWGDSKEEEEI